MPYPSSERLIVFVLALCLSLICEVDLCGFVPTFVRLILVALYLASKCRGGVCN